MITFTEAQTKVLKMVDEFIEDETRHLFTLFGYAGTGKTTVAAEIVRRYGAKPCAYTGRAAKNLGNKCDTEAYTTHGLLYHPLEIEDPIRDPQTGEIVGFRKKLTWKHREDACYAGETLLVDECSMINDTIG